MSLEGENEMKRLTLLLTMLPLVTLADVPSPTYIHRLHRVGYEILPVAGLKEVVTTVLNADHELLLACMALPLELIVDRYFTTERWYNMGRHSFTHPRNVPWSQSEYEAKTVQRTTKETSLTSGDENRK